jgi:hypothetical protein
MASVDFHANEQDSLPTCSHSVESSPPFIAAVRTLKRVDTMKPGKESRIDPDMPMWYRRYRGASYLCTFAAMVWTGVIVLPFAPFSYLPPIIVGGGPGIWFVLAYLLFLVIGVGGFGVMSGFLTTVELHEGRQVSDGMMWPSLLLLSVGLVGSCLLLGVAGAVGGYAATFQASSVTSIDSLLSPYTYPITAFALTAVVGACLAVLSMVRARWPAP